ncbi:DMT family transporter [Candidatus Parcubacteria bacterium]|nr:MAG: DMT family transporter [Candidatus Parcubacteria bacterium]
MDKKYFSYFYLLLCILSWGLIPVVSKKILVELDNYQMLLYSTVFSVLVMGIILLLQRKTNVVKKYELKQFLNIGFLGFLGTYLYYVLLYKALSLTTASEGFILAYTWPILVLVLSFIILKEKATLKKILSLFISFVGILIIVSQGNFFSINFTNLQGDILALIGAFTFALFSVLGKKNNFDPVVSVFIYFLTALILIFPTTIIFSSLKVPSFDILFWILLNGLLVNGVSYIFWFKALKHGDTHILSNLLYLTPFLSLIYISIFLEEEILFSSIVGLVVIVVGIIFQSIKINKILRSNILENLRMR